MVTVPVPGPIALDAFAAEVANLSAVLATVTETEFDRPTRWWSWRCADWTSPTGSTVHRGHTTARSRW